MTKKLLNIAKKRKKVLRFIKMGGKIYANIYV